MHKCCQILQAVRQRSPIKIIVFELDHLFPLQFVVASMIKIVGTAQYSLDLQADLDGQYCRQIAVISQMWVLVCRVYFLLYICLQKMRSFTSLSHQCFSLYWYWWYIVYSTLPFIESLKWASILPQTCNLAWKSIISNLIHLWKILEEDSALFPWQLGFLPSDIRVSQSKQLQTFQKLLSSQSLSSDSALFVYMSSAFYHTLAISVPLIHSTRNIQWAKHPHWNHSGAPVQ